jgi:diguanylate cyclase (GGDEF)-like protein
VTDDSVVLSARRAPAAAPAGPGALTDAEIEDLISATHARGQAGELAAALDTLRFLQNETRRRRNHTLTASALRARLHLTLFARGDDRAAGNLVWRLLRFAKAHDLAAQESSAWAIRARLKLRDGDLNGSLDDVSRAVLLLDRDLPPDRALSTALGDCRAVLNRLALYELTEDLTRRHDDVVALLADPVLTGRHRANAALSLMTWGLHLERAGDALGAHRRYAAAHRYGQDALAVTRGLPAGLLPAAIEAVAYAGAAMAGAHGIDMARLRVLVDGLVAADILDLVTCRVALARTLRLYGLRGDALEVLGPIEELLRGLDHDPIAGAVTWEEMLCHTQGRVDQPEVAAAMRHAARAERDLWAQRQLRLRGAQDRIAHERLRRAHSHASRLAMEDPLTGLPNRRYVDAVLPLAVRQAREGGTPLALAVVDVDRFKDVNDQLSHRFGDSVLRDVAIELDRSMRRHDVVARFGGDEFVVVFEDTPHRAAVNTLKRAATAVAARCWDVPGQDPIRVTLSVGVAALDETSSVEELFAQADRAMYEAKRAGGNRVAVPGGGPPDDLT